MAYTFFSILLICVTCNITYLFLLLIFLGLTLEITMQVMVHTIFFISLQHKLATIADVRTRIIINNVYEIVGKKIRRKKALFQLIGFLLYMFLNFCYKSKCQYLN